MPESGRQSTKEVEAGSIDELTRLVALSLKYQGVPVGVLAYDLSTAGLSPSRVAELIHTTPNTVSQAKRNPRPKWPPARRGAASVASNGD